MTLPDDATTAWDILVREHGPVVPVEAIPEADRAALLDRGRVFKVHIDSDGFGSGDVTFHIAKAGEDLARVAGLNARAAFVLRDEEFALDAALVRLLNRNPWERASEIPNLPFASDAVRSELETRVRSVDPIVSHAAARALALARWHEPLGRWLAERGLPETLAWEEEEAYCLAIAQDALTPAVVTELARSGRQRVRDAIAKGTHVEALEVLADDPSWHVRVSVAENPHTSEAARERLARDENALVRWSVAKTPQTPRRILGPLGRDPEWTVRARVAANPSAGNWISLSKDTVNVRLELAANTGAPATALAAMANDGEISVRVLLACNPSTPPSTLRDLANARPRIVLGRDVDESDWVLQAAVATNPSTPVDVLEMLALRYGDPVRRRVAANASTPLALLENLASDPEPAVRAAVAMNPTAPPALVERLARDSDTNVVYALTHRTDVSLAIQHLLASHPSAMVRRSLAERASPQVFNVVGAPDAALARDPDASVRANVARSPNTPSWILLALASDAVVAVRAGVAMNPNVASHLLERLATDAAPEVLGAVLAHPRTPSTVFDELLAKHPALTSSARRNPRPPLALRDLVRAPTEFEIDDD